MILPLCLLLWLAEVGIFVLREVWGLEIHPLVFWLPAIPLIAVSVSVVTGVLALGVLHLLMEWARK